tara:strand:+ start:125 stop:442 length:318 start_codon:yes stop_codon:yes gene_type:complete
MNRIIVSVFFISFSVSAVEKALVYKEEEELFKLSENSTLAAAQEKYMHVIESGDIFCSLEAYAKLINTYYQVYPDKRPKEKPLEIWKWVKSLLQSSEQKERNFIV